MGVGIHEDEIMGREYMGLLYIVSDAAIFSRTERSFSNPSSVFRRVERKYRACSVRKHPNLWIRNHQCGQRIQCFHRQVYCSRQRCLQVLSYYCCPGQTKSNFYYLIQIYVLAARFIVLYLELKREENEISFACNLDVCWAPLF